MDARTAYDPENRETLTVTETFPLDGRTGAIGVGRDDHGQRWRSFFVTLDGAAFAVFCHSTEASARAMIKRATNDGVAEGAL